MLEIKAENRPFASDLLRDQVFEQNINDVDSHLTEEEADRANYELQQFHTKYNQPKRLDTTLTSRPSQSQQRFLTIWTSWHLQCNPQW